MFNSLLIIHSVVCILLIISILLQRTSSDSLSGLGSSNMGIVSSQSSNDFLFKTTVTLAIIFFVNSIALANLSSKKETSVIEQIENKDTKSIPVQ